MAAASWPRAQRKDSMRGEGGLKQMRWHGALHGSLISAQKAWFFFKSGEMQERDRMQIPLILCLATNSYGIIAHTALGSWSQARKSS